jgi:general secretion pathway protein D
MIRDFLSKIEKNTSSQVLIEAKVVEVALNDRYQSGINWTNFGGNSLRFGGDLENIFPAASGQSAPTLTLLKNDILQSGIDLSASVKLLSEFGTTRALSSPRLHAINNQQAVLSFAENLVYFKVEITQTDAVLGTNGQVVTPAKVTIKSDEKRAPVGIILNLQPSINKDTDEVTLSVRPTLTRLVKFVADPGFQVVLADVISKYPAGSSISNELRNVTSLVPQIETRELDSIMKIKSGQTLVIGGLLEDKVINNDSGVPGVSEVPWVGNLFKSVDKQNTKKELVIFIRATIIGTNGSADQADKALYEKFMKDPRPLQFNQ